MKKLLVALLALMFLLPAPAFAIHKGAVVQEFPGPDGPGGAHLWAKLVIDDHDFQPQIRAMLVFSNPGDRIARVHVSYLKLVRFSTDVRNTGSFIVDVPAHETLAVAGTYVFNPNGTYHSRTRLWVCFSGFACGNVKVWNSQDVRY